MVDDEPQVGDWIALYGSLMRGLGAMEELGLSDRLRYVGPCIIAGELFDLGHYPGMRHGDGRVIAELYALLGVRVIEELDEFEDYTPSQRGGSLYLRESVALIQPSNTDAWLYVYNAVPNDSARIADGDWRAHLARRVDA